MRSPHPGKRSAVISLHTGSGVGEQEGGLIGAEEKVINSKNKVDENMVSHFSPPPCPVLILRLIRMSGIVLEAFQMNLPVFTFHMVQDGWTPTGPTNLLYSLASGYEKE